VSGSGISWAICISAPHSRQITMPTPHHSVFLQARCPSCRPTNSIKALKAIQSTEQYNDNQLKKNKKKTKNNRQNQSTQIWVFSCRQWHDSPMGQLSYSSSAESAGWPNTYDHKTGSQPTNNNFYPFLFARSTFDLVLQKANQLCLLTHGLLHAVFLILMAHLQLIPLQLR